MAGDWRNSFQVRDRRPAPATPAPEAEEGQQPCARGEWCLGRTVTVQDGERVVTPAWTYRPYCDLCASFISDCARDLPGFYLRLEFALGDPLQAEVQVRQPFGPQVPVREDIDAHLRLSASLLAGWEQRVRAAAKLSRPDPRARIGTCAAVKRAAAILAAHTSALLALQPGAMTRTFRMPFDDDTSAWLADCEIVRTGEDYADVLTEVGGEDAGREVQFLHYRCRSLLLETNPPPEILISPCRECMQRTLRRAYPSGSADLFSRCTNCRDEMTSDEFDVNAKRWVAYHKAQRRAVLGDPLPA